MIAPELVPKAVSGRTLGPKPCKSRKTGIEVHVGSECEDVRERDFAPRRIYSVFGRQLPERHLFMIS